MGYIYKITNRCTDKSYIGYTENPDNRWLAHQYKQGSKIVWQAIKKYGLENISFEVIAQDSVDNENNYIVEHNTIAPNGYNIVPGGGLPPNHKGKSYAEIYGVDRALEQRAKRQVKQLAAGGYGPANHTKETKRKIRESVIIAHANRDCSHSEDTKNKIGKAMKGKMAGAKNPKARSIVLASPEGQEYNCFGTLKETCDMLGLSYATIRSALKYNRVPNSGTAKGWTVNYNDN